jgi:protocatechuate 3,4-dioxygenase beta subunit
MIDERALSRDALIERARAASRARLSRRSALQGVGVGLGVLVGCGDDDGGGAAGGAGGNPSGSASAGTTAAGAGGSSAATGTGSATVWATGGTAAMLGAASYPDPFDTPGSTCTSTCILTQGPCWAPSAPVRRDISEGEPGIPLRLMLRILDADGCTPVNGAEVEIWYCNIEGQYSAEDAQSPGFCTGNDAAALAGYFFRGRAIADVAGKVTFDGCFPGWYPGRSIHIHLLVRPAASAGEATTTNAVAISQIFFPEALTAEIFETVSGYVEQRQPDTSFADDNVLTSVEDITPYVVAYERMSDGAMLAWKDIVISSSQSCGSGGVGGGGPGGGGPSGPPPGGTPPA